MEVRKGLKMVQLAGEMAIPLLGYYWWHWSYYFLLLFYLLDLLANTVMTQMKINKTQLYRGEPSRHWIGFAALSTLLILGIIVPGVQLMFRLYSHFDLPAESLRFIMLKDMGLPQGVFLFPLVIYAAYLNYKVSFLGTQQFKVITSQAIKKAYFRALFLVLAALALALAVSFFISIPEVFCVWVTVLLIGVYSYFFKS